MSLTSKMKCRVCREPAVIDLRRHNANFCHEHFVAHCEEQVRRAIRHFSMIGPDDRVVVAVSGGKDSYALLDALMHLHEADPSEAIAEPQVSSSTGDAGEAAAARVERRRARYSRLDLIGIEHALRAGHVRRRHDGQQRPVHASPPARSIRNPLGRHTRRDLQEKRTNTSARQPGKALGRARPRRGNG